MADEETTPSAPRKKEVDLGRGVVILPPERMFEEKRPEQKKEEAVKRIEQKKDEVFRSPQPLPSAAPNNQGVLILVVGILAIIAILVSLITLSTIITMKSELKGVTADLNSFSQSKFQISTTLNMSHTIQSSVPLKEALSPFTLPVPSQEIRGTGTFEVMLPGYDYAVDVPWNGTITVFGTVTVNTSQLSNDRTLSLSYTLPNSGNVVMTVSGSDLFGGQLENITSILDKMSR